MLWTLELENFSYSPSCCKANINWAWTQFFFGYYLCQHVCRILALTVHLIEHILWNGTWVVYVYSSNERLIYLQDEWHSVCHCTTLYSLASYPIPPWTSTAKISLLTYVVATYFASIVESATTFCSFEIQLTVVPPTVNTYHVVLLLLSLSPSISASTYPCRIVSEPPKHNRWEVVPLKYLKIHYIAFQCSLPGLFIYLLITPIACAISGLVHTMAYIKLPTVDE